MRAGDTVLHLPSGERWIVRIVDGRDVWPCGYPESLGRLKDCYLETACSDEKHKAMLERCIQRGFHSQLAIRQLQDLEKSFVGMHI